MRKFTKFATTGLLLLSLVVSLLSFNVSAASIDPTTPTGYTKAEDVVYKTSGKYVANWGARGENCVFLSTYAQNFYTGSYSYATLIQNAGGTAQNNAHKSALYSALKSMMSKKHTYINSYKENNNLFCYTDCVRNETSILSSFYSGTIVGSAWVSGGGTYNKEHTWPNSKGLGGSDEDDIMMIRPTVVSENSSRGNTAYGESSGYYDPDCCTIYDFSVRGDCARIVLYTYVRWGNTSKAWGQSGVIENLDVLLKWMQEDPVDTWEMGRNDAVQSITGTRNVFIDYPELAWTLFGRQAPKNMSTPSGNAASGNTGSGNSGNSGNTSNSGNSGNTGSSGNSGTTKPAACTHTTTELRNVKQATCQEEGYSGDTHCTKCGKKLASGKATAKTGHTETLANQKDATCAEAGYTGDTVCSVCNVTLETGKEIPKSHSHTFGDWATTKQPTATEAGEKARTCEVCGFQHKDVLYPIGGSSEPYEPETPSIWIWVGIGAAGCAIVVAVTVILLKKKKK